MAFTPNQISLVYKKTLAPAEIGVELQLEFVIPYQVEFEKPAWIKLILQNWDNATKLATYRVTVDVANASNLAAGNYSGTIKAREKLLFGTPPPPYELHVQLKVVNTVRLSISRSSYSFSYVVGDTPPPTQLLSIDTENNWSIVLDKPWATTSSSNGTGRQSVSLGVDVAGLSPGIYECNFLVDDGRDTKSGSITLLVNGPAGGDDYLDLSLTGINFSEVFEAPPVSSATVNIKSSLPVTITSDTPWLELSHTSFPEGESNLTVSTVNTEAIPVGSRIGSFTIQSGYSARVVNVLLRIVEIVTGGLESNGFYFANDRNVLFLSTSDQNAEALLEFAAQTEQNLITYTKRIPFFENSVESVVGLETETLLKPLPLPEFQSGVFAPIVPLRIDLRVFDKQLNSTALTQRSNFTNISFIKGRTPAVQSLKLSNIPSIITTVKDGVVVLSFISEEPVTEIKITGDISQSIAVTQPAGKIFTAVVNLAVLNLLEGQKINITCGPATVQVIIKPSELDTFQLIWLNEWDCPEVINLDGTVEMIEEDDSKTVSVAEAGRIISRIIDIKEPQSFRVNTGNIYSDAEVKWLARVLRSKKMWLQINGERIEVVRTFRSLSTFQTRGFLRDYSLTFDAAVR